MPSITFEKQNGLAIISLNRPEAYNSFNREMARSLQEKLDQCALDDEIRAVYLTGNGKAFCAGQDLKEVTDPELHPGFKTILEEHYGPIIRKIRNLPKPVLAAVNGVAAGAGANIALSCDIVVATASASFIQAFSKIGLVPDSAGTFFLPRLIGFQKALAISMLGDKVGAAEAESMGMIYKAMPDEEFGATSLKLAHKLASMPTKGLAYTKELFNQSMSNDLEAQLALETTYQITASETNDYQEGVNAFIEKRKPHFNGN